jgi:hypothetical protein
MTDDDYDSYQKKSSRKKSPPNRSASRSTGREHNDLDGDQRFVPKSRPVIRRKSSRRLVVESAPAPTPVAAAAAARGHAASMPSVAASAARFKQDDLDDSNSTSSRNNSWYADALLQQGGSRSQLEEILGGSKEQLDEIFGESQQGSFSFEDEEQVLEQYRIMAQHEAISRVKENTGFDMAEYEKKKKMNGEGTGGDSKLAKRSKVRLPEPKRITSTNSTPKAEEPAMPAPRLNTRFMHQRMNRTPELCPGVVMRGSTMPSDEHAVRCLGCKCQLRVKILASLVSCPDCSTVSSASSTRR